MGSHANASISTTPPFKSKNQIFRRTLSSPATAISAHGIQRHELSSSFVCTSSAKPLFGQRKSERAAVGRRTDGRIGKSRGHSSARRCTQARTEKRRSRFKRRLARAHARS